MNLQNAKRAASFIRKHYKTAGPIEPIILKAQELPDTGVTGFPFIVHPDGYYHKMYVGYLFPAMQGIPSITLGMDQIGPSTTLVSIRQEDIGSTLYCFLSCQGSDMREMTFVGYMTPIKQFEY